jgi:hypothetical protein
MHHTTAPLSLVANQQAFLFDVGSRYEYLDYLKGRRDPRGVRYPLALALVFILLAKLAGEQEPRGIAQWVALRKELLSEALHFQRPTTPVAITFSRILGKVLEVCELQEMVSRFLLSAPEGGQGVEINLDGKALRGTIPAGQTKGHQVLPAYLPDQGIVLMQVEVGAKENELACAPRLLKSIDLQGKIVTGDAMFTQRELSRQAVEAGGEDVWSVKENQPRSGLTSKHCMRSKKARPSSSR